MNNPDHQRGALIGLAVGDALGAAVEFKHPGTFTEVTGYRDEVLAPSWEPVLRLKQFHKLHPEIEEIAEGSFRRKEPPEIVGSGYVVRSLEAALWAFHDAREFREAVLRAVNLGDDADTTGAICGQLAGAYWGESGIPAEWLDGLDRLSRSLQDGVNTLCKLLDNGIRLVGVAHGLDYSAVEGKMAAALLLAVAEMEQQHRRERQAVGMKNAKKRGADRGRKPGSFKASPERARALKERGLTLPEIAQALGVSEGTVSRYLRMV